MAMFIIICFGLFETSIWLCNAVFRGDWFDENELAVYLFVNECDFGLSHADYVYNIVMWGVILSKTTNMITCVCLGQCLIN